ncbi:BatD family protein [Thalassomonas sp. M1454]|uniref:BatD family protein n=1 Tax=Thalassomonas sp. M1454 TaxID=2594477 RepID=UPI00117BEDD9|nr:BatD family protein [Thalassomonas sp. M1454]TRX56496.1 protein BatD [Thalassomonas sp. M1454]
MQTVNALFQCSMHNFIKLFLSALIITLTSFTSANAASSASVDDLIQNGQLKLSINLKPQSQIVLGQQAILEIKLISHYDFSDNMTVDFFNIENAIVAKPFARTDFKIDTIDGKKWFIQTKEVALYPIKEGEFYVAPILTEAFISVEGKAVYGNIQTPDYTFSITQADKLTARDDYIASSKLDVVRQVSKQPEQPLRIGSAVTLTRQIHADNLHSVMLPDLQPIKFEGVQIYEKPQTKSDSYDVLREINIANLSSSVTLIFQQEGLFKLPAETIFWWNTNKNQLETIKVPEMSFQVGESNDEIIANAPTKADGQQQISLSGINWWLVIVICTALFFTLAIAKVIKQNKQAIVANFKHRIYYKQLINRYFNAIEQNKYQQALACLYKISDIKHNNMPALKALVKNEQAQATLELLFTLAFGKKVATDSISKQSANALLQAIINKKFETNFFTPVKYNMKLN